MLARQATEKPTVAAAPKPLKQNAATAENNYGITNPPTGPHTQGNLIVTPEQAASEKNLTQALKPGAQFQGMKNAARKTLQEHIADLKAKGASDLEVQAILRQEQP